MKFCLNCGEELPEKAHFCPNCGLKSKQHQVKVPGFLVQSCIKIG
ncbi:zinc-ribbon domain-containing protein, partial [Pediococcus acidilactici]